MFGESIDYHLLKPLTHSRSRATEEELNAAARYSEFTLDDARTYLHRVQTEFFPGRFPIDKKLSYLDIGCGMGRLSIGLIDAGAENVTGIDISERHIVEATVLAEKLIPEHPSTRAPAFYCADFDEWQHESQYDVIIALCAMEHVNDPRNFLHQVRESLTPNGLMFASFVPFHSVFGDHMEGFFRVQIPWRGVLFSEAAILRLRAECFRPTDPAKRYQDIVGGLNLMRFTEYCKWVDEAGLEFVCHNFNPQIKSKNRFKALYPLSWVLTRIPKMQDYFGVCICSVIRRRP